MLWPGHCSHKKFHLSISGGPINVRSEAGTGTKPLSLLTPQFRNRPNSAIPTAFYPILLGNTGNFSSPFLSNLINHRFLAYTWSSSVGEHEEVMPILRAGIGSEPTHYHPHPSQFLSLQTTSRSRIGGPKIEQGGYTHRSEPWVPQHPLYLHSPQRLPHPMLATCSNAYRHRPGVFSQYSLQKGVPPPDFWRHHPLPRGTTGPEYALVIGITTIVLNRSFSAVNDRLLAHLLAICEEVG